MALRINFNYSSAVTQTALEANNRLMGKSLLRLSTGLRILNAADDSAGLFIADQLAVVSAGLEQGNRNIQTGISALQIAENSAGQIYNKLKQIYVKAQSAANDINDPNARAALQREIQNLVDAIQKIGTDTEYNGLRLLDGSFQSKYIHYGPRVDQKVDVSISDLRAISLGAYIATGQGATSSIVSFSATGGSLSNFLNQLNTVNNGNFVLSGTSENVSIGSVTVYQGSATPELVDAAKLAQAINSNQTLQNEGITATASNESVANTYTTSVVSASLNTDNDSASTFTVKLNFYIGDGSKSFTVDLATVTTTAVAGGADTVNVTTVSLSQLVNNINGQAGLAGAPITAIDDNGKLKLVTTNGETIGIEVVTQRTSGTDTVDISVDLSQILEGGSTVTATNVSTAQYSQVAKTGKIYISSPNAFSISYNGVSDNGTSANEGLNFDYSSGSQVGLQNLYSINVFTNADAEKALMIIDMAIRKVDTVRSQIGAVMNNLQSIYDAQKVAMDNTNEAENVIRNVDFSKEMTTFTTMQIRMQSGVAMLAQANTLPQLVLQLLR